MRFLRSNAVMFVLGLVFLVGSMGCRKPDNVLIYNIWMIPVGDWEIHRFILPKNANLSFEFTQEGDQQFMVMLFTESNYDLTIERPTRKAGNARDVPSIYEQQATEVKASGIALDAGNYVIWVSNRSEQTLSVRGKLVVRY